MVEINQHRLYIPFTFTLWYSRREKLDLQPEKAQCLAQTLNEDKSIKTKKCSGCKPVSYKIGTTSDPTNLCYITKSENSFQFNL